MDTRISHWTYHKVCEAIHDLDEVMKTDLLLEMVYEWQNDRWSDSDSRLKGTIEAMEAVLNMEIL